MDNKEIVKKYLLKKKIEEFFSKNPSSSSVIIEADISGPSKTVWKVERKQNKYKITEVRTIKEQYLFEAPGEEEPKKKVASSDQEQPAPEQQQPPPQDSQESEPEPLPINRTDEEMLLVQNLKGQTIREADIDLNANGGTLTLAFVGVENPMELTWNKEGKVIFSFKGRPYNLRK